jgi:hypothetical protein
VVRWDDAHVARGSVAHDSGRSSLTRA